ncbi:hypothetical protein BMS3Abin07_01348 [bacterium BMS3Abin07]|nr:hypothetical protein BMS3Abin07_01348 [bacterium BMS3Abin07]GBE32189.1 hypothetical protein BMS3Bbin05_01098 [bacterium BMS3Bbin05]
MVIMSAGSGRIGSDGRTGPVFKYECGCIYRRIAVTGITCRLEPFFMFMALSTVFTIIMIGEGAISPPVFGGGMTDLTDAYRRGVCPCSAFVIGKGVIVTLVIKKLYIYIAVCSVNLVPYQFSVYQSEGIPCIYSTVI